MKVVVWPVGMVTLWIITEVSGSPTHMMHRLAALACDRRGKQVDFQGLLRTLH